MKLFACLFAATAFLAACDSGSIAAATRDVDAASYGEDWPFSVSEAELSCPNRYPALTANGVTYGLTMGGTMQGLADIKPIRLVRPDLADRFGDAAAEMGAPLPLVNMDAVVEMALELCYD